MKCVSVNFALDCSRLSQFEIERRLTIAKRSGKEKLKLREVNTQEKRRLSKMKMICIDRNAHFLELYKAMEVILDALGLDWDVVWVKPAHSTHYMTHPAYIEEAMGGDYRKAANLERFMKK